MAMGPYEGQECNSGDKQQKVYEFFYSIEEFIENIFSGTCSSTCVEESVKQDSFEGLREKALKPASKDAIDVVESFDELYRNHKRVEFALPVKQGKFRKGFRPPTFTEEEENLQSMECPDCTLENEERPQQAKLKLRDEFMKKEIDQDKLQE